MAGVAYNQIKDGGVYTIANHIINGGGFHNYIWYNTSNSKAAYGPAPDEENYKWIAHKVNSNIYYFENYTHRGKFLNMESGGLTDSPYNYTLSNGHNGATGYITLQNGVIRYGGWYGAYDGTSGSGDRYGFGKYGSGGCISTQGTAQATSTPYWSTDWELVFTGTYVQPDAPFSLSPSDEEWAENTRWYYINLPYTGGYLGYGSGYSDANGLLVNNTTKPDGEAGLWAIVKVGDRVQFYNKASGRTLVLSAPSGGDPEKLAMLDRTLTVSNQTTANPSIVKENAWSLLPTNKDINGTQSGYFLYRHNSGVWHRCVVFNDNHLVTAYGNGESANASSMEANLVSKMVLIPAETVTPKWDVAIIGGTADDRVVFSGTEYISGSKIETESITATSISTNINNRFVWGPIIDNESHTVTFEERSIQAESIIGGRFYQLQMFNKDGQWFDSSVKSGNMVDGVNSCTSPSVRYKGSQIYLMNARAAGYPMEFTGVVPESEIYYSYVYVPAVSGSNVQIQGQNGSYVNSNGSANSNPTSISFAYDSTNKTFKWPTKVGPWSWTNTANWVTIAMSSSFTDANYNIELFFHPVTTGEDYDIYKVKNNEAAVVCNSSSLVTTIINAGGTFFFVQKGATLTASDFTINGEEPQSISTTRNGDFIELTLTEAPHEVHEITSLSAIDNMYGRYKLTADVDAPSQITSDFHGHLDGDYHKITGLTHAIFNNIDGAKISNLIIEDVNISGDIVGAIANTATGNSRVYNCGIIATNAKNVDHDQTFTSSSKISGTTAGSIVGKIEGNARVVNCYSYADVNGTNAGGIVGDWAGTWYNGTTGLMVANCMYYGNLTGTNRSPIVYGGSDINGSYSIYSYFRWKSMSTTNFTRQNGALAATEDIWLDRFKFFQAGVTNHRDIAAYYVFGDASRISEIGQWYIDETIAPWPILRKAEKRTTILSKATQVISSSAADKEPNTGAIITDVKNDITKRYDKMPGTNGKLTVNFTINGTNFTKDLPITDMDDKHYDYTWGKVVLPFANEFEGWIPDYDYICTGWEITSVTGGTVGTVTDYNYADRDCTAKDIYNATNNPIIFAQGGNYIVPYGVTAITVNAHFAKAYYLSDPNYDCAAGGANAHGGTRPTTYRGKTVYTTAAAAWGAMQAKTLPHDQALVLVGNYHYTSNDSGSHTAKGCTVISIDEDCDQQPDYGWYMAMGTVRQSWMPVRWDFVPIIGSGLIQIASDMLPSLSIPRARGWFEISETALCRTYEFEVNDGSMTAEDNRKGNNAYIIKGGWFQQLVRCFDQATNNRMSYFHIGGNAYIKEFFPGNHSSTHLTYNIRPVNVTGGDIESCFMTGQNPGSTIIGIDNNVRFYCSGGNIGKYLSVYMEQPVVNATMKVDHARIGRFFGGGTTPNAQLSGNIDITMNYSNVDFFCGGPEFGDMTAEKTVTVNTTGSTFGEFYGAGFGGTALTRHRYREVIDNNASMSSIDNYSSIRLQYDTAKGGVGVSYEMESLLNGSGVKLFRFYDNYAALSMAQTGSVTTNATNCLFKENFFGGGCQGKVDGSITSVLNNCYVTGSVYGGGYKASATEINVYPTTGGTYPEFNTTYKAFSTYGTYPTPEVYTWVSGTDGTVDTSAQTIATSVDMTQMGTVTGNTSLTIKGADSVVTGDVFGGGAESKVLGNSTVVIGEQP